LNALESAHWNVQANVRWNGVLREHWNAQVRLPTLGGSLWDVCGCQAVQTAEVVQQLRKAESQHSPAALMACRKGLNKLVSEQQQVFRKQLDSMQPGTLAVTSVAAAAGTASLTLLGEVHHSTTHSMCCCWCCRLQASVHWSEVRSVPLNALGSAHWSVQVGACACLPQCLVIACNSAARMLVSVISIPLQ
jgi:hypothetical protein